MIDSARVRAVVARRRGHEHPSLPGEQERYVVRVEVVGVPIADRVIDHVDAIGNGGVDPGDQVGYGAPTGPAGLVGGDARTLPPAVMYW